MTNETNTETVGVRDWIDATSSLSVSLYMPGTTIESDTVAAPSTKNHEFEKFEDAMKVILQVPKSG